MAHNVYDVIGDLEDVKDDIEDEMMRGLRADMQRLAQRAKNNVRDDADYTGQLLRSIGHRVYKRNVSEKIVGRVRASGRIAPYAPLVEFGTGSHDLQTAPGVDSEQPRPPMEGSPIDFPYAAPTITTDDQFKGLVGNIIEWVENKPVFPRNEDMTQEDLGYAIAASIVANGTYAHPFLQPAWFQTELEIRQGNRAALADAVS